MYLIIRNKQLKQILEHLQTICTAYTIHYNNNLSAATAHISFTFRLILTLSLPDSNLESINVVETFKSMDETLVCDHPNEKLSSSTFKWCCLFLKILQNEIQILFPSVLNLGLGSERVKGLTTCKRAHQQAFHSMFACSLNYL